MKIKRVEHIGIAVDDFAGMLRLFRDDLGLDLEYVEELTALQTRLAMLPAGETYIELLEGTSPESLTSRWIAEKGRGLWHICFEVDDIDSAMQELRAKGVKLQNDEPLIGHGNSRICFLDPAASGNVLIELAQLAHDAH
jgi:methylmalonyl-CoA epimerase